MKKLLTSMTAFALVCLMLFTSCIFSSDEEPQKKESLGLAYEYLGNLMLVGETCMLVGPGTCTDIDVVIPKKGSRGTVTAIGEMAFYGYPNLNSVVIPNSVEYIGKGAFYRCEALTSVVIPDSVQTIDEGAFCLCVSLESITIPDSVHIIKADTFHGCSSLKNVELPAFLSYIEANAFAMCTSLESIKIPETVKSIDAYAFHSCTALSNIEVDENNQYYKSIDGNLYSKDGKTLIKYASGKKESSFTIPASVEKIAMGAFQACENLKMIDVENNSQLSIIDDRAFYNCYSLTSVSIPKTVTEFVGSVFYSCPSLTRIVYTGTADQFKAIKKVNGWDYAIGDYIVYCNDGQVTKDEASEITQIEYYDGSNVTISFWHLMGADKKALLERAIARFNELYPNIKIEHTSYGDYDGIYDQIRTKLTVGKQPNIAFCLADHVASYNRYESVLALDELINNQNVVESTGEMMGLTQAQIDDFIEAFYNEGRGFGDGKMYMLPFQKSTDVLYYNKTVFDSLGLEAPKTWDDVEEAIKVLVDAYPMSIPLGYDSSENFFITLSAQYNSPYTSATGEHYLFNNDTSKAFVEKFAEWYQKGWMTTSELMGGSYTSDAFRKGNDELGKAFMSIGSSAGARYYRPDKVNGEYPFEIGIVPVPQVDPDSPKAISQGHSVCIFEDDNMQEVYASWLFVKFLLTDVEFQSNYSASSGYVPAIKSVYDSSDYQAFINKADGGEYITALAAKVAYEQSDYCFTSPAFVGSADARTQVGYLTESVFIKYVIDTDNSAMIDEEFQKYYDICKGNY